MKSFNEHRQVIEKILSESNSETPDLEIWKKWRSLVNMSGKEFQSFCDSEESKDADLKDVSKESAKSLISMIPDGISFSRAEEKWTPTMWKWCRKQVSVISRMRGMRKRIIGNPFEKNGKMTKWLKSMMMNGHDPRKPLRKL